MKRTRALHALCYRAIAVALVVVLGACSGADIGETGTRAEKSFGLLSVSYVHDWESARGASAAPELITTAQFVRYSALDRDQVARLLALPLDPSQDLPATGQCKLYDLSLDLGQEGVIEGTANEGTIESNVELLEAGNLRIATSERNVTLKPKHYPGLLPFISGVIYGEAQSDRAGHPGNVTISADGGEAVGAFKLQSKSPALPQLIEIAGSSPDRGPTLRRGQHMHVAWRKPVSDKKSNDIRYLELRRIAGERDVVLRCLPAASDHRFTISAEQLALLSQTVGTRISIELSQIRRATFDASGLQQGELRLKSTDTAALTIN
jgi:hypothetical protein